MEFQVAPEPIKLEPNEAEGCLGALHYLLVDLVADFLAGAVIRKVMPPTGVHDLDLDGIRLILKSAVEIGRAHV